MIDVVLAARKVTSIAPFGEAVPSERASGFRSGGEDPNRSRMGFRPRGDPEPRLVSMDGTKQACLETGVGREDGMPRSESIGSTPREDERSRRWAPPFEETIRIPTPPPQHLVGGKETIPGGVGCVATAADEGRGVGGSVGHRDQEDEVPTIASAMDL